mmetsp:Transcript_24753/g.44017  ORF Transcript_24753/g.44017 Transcript_24753/m.44017 type:complete len:247 (+) Transcript_24753:261-1001(+)
MVPRLGAAGLYMGEVDLRNMPSMDLAALRLPRPGAEAGGVAGAAVPGGGRLGAVEHRRDLLHCFRYCPHLCVQCDERGLPGVHVPLRHSEPKLQEVLEGHGVVLFRDHHVQNLPQAPLHRRQLVVLLRHHRNPVLSQRLPVRVSGRVAVARHPPPFRPRPLLRHTGASGPVRTQANHAAQRRLGPSGPPHPDRHTQASALLRRTDGPGPPKQAEAGGSCGCSSGSGAGPSAERLVQHAVLRPSGRA